MQTKKVKKIINDHKLIKKIISDLKEVHDVHQAVLCLEWRLALLQIDLENIFDKDVPRIVSKIFSHGFTFNFETGEYVSFTDVYMSVNHENGSNVFSQTERVGNNSFETVKIGMVSCLIEMEKEMDRWGVFKSLKEGKNE